MPLESNSNGTTRTSKQNEKRSRCLPDRRIFFYFQIANPQLGNLDEQQIIAVAVGKVPAAEGGRENFWETQDTIVDFSSFQKEIC